MQPRLHFPPAHAASLSTSISFCPSWNLGQPTSPFHSHVITVPCLPLLQFSSTGIGKTDSRNLSFEVTHVLVCWGCHNYYHKLRGLNQTFIVSQFQGLKV